MAIKGVSVGLTDSRVTLPVCGMYVAKTKDGKAYMLYIDHFTSMSKEHRSYKPIPILTRTEDSLFRRLCSAFKVTIPSKITQKAAAELLAAGVSQYGAIKCKRVGKQQDWQEIAAVNLDGEMLPWGHKIIEGMKMISLWQVDDGSGRMDEGGTPPTGIQAPDLSDIGGDDDEMRDLLRRMSLGFQNDDEEPMEMPEG